jgi:hypothetical protein
MAQTDNPNPKMQLSEAWGERMACPICAARPLGVFHPTGHADRFACPTCETSFELEEVGKRVRFVTLPPGVTPWMRGQWVVLEEALAAFEIFRNSQSGVTIAEPSETPPINPPTEPTANSPVTPPADSTVQPTQPPKTEDLKPASAVVPEKPAPAQSAAPTPKKVDPKPPVEYIPIDKLVGNSLLFSTDRSTAKPTTAPFYDEDFSDTDVPPDAKVHHHSEPEKEPWKDQELERVKKAFVNPPTDDFAGNLAVEPKSTTAEPQKPAPETVQTSAVEPKWTPPESQKLAPEVVQTSAAEPKWTPPESQKLAPEVVQTSAAEPKWTPQEPEKPASEVVQTSAAEPKWTPPEPEKPAPEIVQTSTAEPKWTPPEPQKPIPTTSQISAAEPVVTIPRTEAANQKPWASGNQNADLNAVDYSSLDYRPPIRPLEDTPPSIIQPAQLKPRTMFSSPDGELDDLRTHITGNASASPVNEQMEDALERAMELQRLGNSDREVRAILERSSGLTPDQVSEVLKKLEKPEEKRRSNRILFIFLAIALLLFALLAWWFFNNQTLFQSGAASSANQGAAQSTNPLAGKLVDSSSLPAPLQTLIPNGIQIFNEAPVVEQVSEEVLPPADCPRSKTEAAALFGGPANDWNQQVQSNGWVLVTKTQGVEIKVPANMTGGYLVFEKGPEMRSVSGPAIVKNIYMITIACQ